MLTQVGRAGAALALGAAHLDALHGDAHAELCLQLARTAVTGGQWADAEDYVERAGRPDDPRSLVLRADAAFGAGRGVEAGELAARAVARAEETGAAAALCEALGVVSRVAWRTDLDVTESAARRAAQVAAEHGLTPWRVRALFDLGMMRMLRADDRTVLDRARELALDAGMLGQVAAMDFVRSDYLWYVEGPRAMEAVVRPLATADPPAAAAAAAGRDRRDGRDARARRPRRRRGRGRRSPSPARCARPATATTSVPNAGRSRRCSSPSSSTTCRGPTRRSAPASSRCWSTRPSRRRCRCSAPGRCCGP